MRSHEMGGTPPSPEEKQPAKKTLFNKIHEIVEQRPLQKDLGSRETINIGGVELKKGDHVYSKTTDGRTIEWNIQYWNNFGVCLRPANAGSLNLKDRLLGGADEDLFEWSRLDMFSAKSDQ